jgi:hypothetical protein
MSMHIFFFFLLAYFFGLVALFEVFGKDLVPYSCVVSRFKWYNAKGSYVFQLFYKLSDIDPMPNFIGHLLSRSFF